MKSLFMVRLTFALLAIGGSVSAWLLSSTAHADVPATLPIQGYLTEIGTERPLDGTAEMTVAIYSGVDQQEPLFEETQSVVLRKGAFTVVVGASEELDLSLFADHPGIEIGIQVNDDVEMAPRLTLGAVAYAAHAAHVDRSRHQARVSGDCGTNETISKVYADGRVECAKVPALQITNEYVDTDDDGRMPVAMTSTADSFCFLTYVRSQAEVPRSNREAQCSVYRDSASGKWNLFALRRGTGIAVCKARCVMTGTSIIQEPAED